MPTPESLNALADRVEREEPSFELDSTIYEDALPVEEKRRIVDLPAYTTSLDAALTLVPEDWTAWELISHAAKTLFSADLSRLTTCGAGEDWAHGLGRTPALALCAAALRARAALADPAPADPPKVRT